MDFGIQFWPVWDTQRRQFPIHVVLPFLCDGSPFSAVLNGDSSSNAEDEYLEQVDLTSVRRLAERLEGYETLPPPALLALPVHHQTLAKSTRRYRLAQAIGGLPKRVRERLIVAIHGLPNGIMGMRLAEMLSPLRGRCVNTSITVNTNFRAFDILRQNRIVILEVVVRDGIRDEFQLASLKRFANQAQHAGLVMAAANVEGEALRSWALADCRYVSGPAIADPLDRLGPTAHFKA